MTKLIYKTIRVRTKAYIIYTPLCIFKED